MRSVLIAFMLAAATFVAQEKRPAASNGWVKTPAAGETQTTAFVTIENPGMYEVNVTSAKSDAADTIALRDGGRAVTFINVPAFGTMEMTQSGGHLLLVGLKRPLKDGDTVTLTLGTDVDVTLTVTAAVRKE